MGINNIEQKLAYDMRKDLSEINELIKSFVERYGLAITIETGFDEPKYTTRISLDI